MKYRMNLIYILVPMAVVFWGLTIMRRLIQYFSGAEVSPIYYSTLIGGTAGILLAAIAIRHFYATVITEERIKGVTLIGNIAEIAWKDKCLQYTS